MFEDTILVGQRTAKRWSVPVSFTIELAGIGLVILLPLIYGERLPFQPPAKVVVYLAPHHAETEIKQQVRNTRQSPRPMVNPTSGITAPIRIPPHPAMINDPAPSIPGSELLAGGPPAGVPGIGAADLLPKDAMRPPEPPRPAVKPQPPKPIRVSAGVQEARRVAFVMPVYPPLARQARISGRVELVGVIAADGTIQSLRVISGHPILVQAALDAVRQWRYLPTQLNGQPVEVIAPITVTFSLQ